MIDRFERIHQALSLKKSAITPLPTILHDQLQNRGIEMLDDNFMRMLIDQNLHHGFHLFPRATTGIAPYASRKDSESLTKLASSRAGSESQLVFAGVPNAGTDEITMYINDFLMPLPNVSGAVIHPPPLMRPTADEILHHLTTIIENCPKMPIILYEFNDLFGVSYEGILTQLLKEKNIVALKFSGQADVAGFMRQVQQHQKYFLIGNEHECVDFLVNGADGVVPSAANVVGPLYRRLLDAVMAENQKELDILRNLVVDQVQHLYPAMIEDPSESDAAPRKQYQAGIVTALHFLYGTSRMMPSPKRCILTPKEDTMVLDYLLRAIEQGALKDTAKERLLELKSNPLRR